MFNLSDELVNNNKEFDKFLKDTSDNDKIVLTKMMIMLGVFLFSLFYIVDFISADENVWMIVAIRSTAIVSMLIFLFYTKDNKFLLRNYEKLLLFIYMVGATAISLMIHVSDGTEITYNTYFAGLMLMVVAIFPYVYLNIKLLFIFSLIIIVQYILVFYVLRGDYSDDKLAMTANNVFFIFGALTLGVISDLLKKKHLYRVFRTSHRLRQFVLTKTDFDMYHSVLSIYEANQILDALLSDAKLCNINMRVKRLRVKSLTDLNKIKKQLGMLIPFKCKIIIIDNKTLIYAFLHKYEDADTAITVMNQLDDYIHDNSKYRDYSFENIYSMNDKNGIFCLDSFDLSVKNYKDKASVVRIDANK